MVIAFGLLAGSSAVVAQAPVAPAATASAPAKTEAAPVPNKGDTAWMMVSTLLVILKTVPGLALFYGDLVRSKNRLSVLMFMMPWFTFSYLPIAHMVWF